jgi:hypothetical protein
MMMLIHPAEHVSRKGGKSPTGRTMSDILSHKNSDVGQSIFAWMGDCSFIARSQQ